MALPDLLGLVWVCLAPFELRHGCGGFLGHDGAPRRKAESLAGEFDKNRKPLNVDIKTLALYKVGS